MAKDVFADRMDQSVVVLENQFKEVRIEFYDNYLIICIVKPGVGLFGKTKYYNPNKWTYSQLTSFMYKYEKKLLLDKIHVRIDFGIKLMDWDQVIQYSFDIPTGQTRQSLENFFDKVEKKVNG